MDHDITTQEEYLDSLETGTGTHDYLPPAQHSVVGLACYAIAHWFVVAGAWCLHMAARALSVAIEKAPEMVTDKAPVVPVQAPMWSDKKARAFRAQYQGTFVAALTTPTR